ncbi:MAG: U32 family peptidase [Gammaproteobacteria bacterium]|nr:U32 family peptidase [Gammaproteobacteria bacterium]
MNRLELICPAGSLPALRAAVDGGADAVYMGLRNATNARNFPGLNFSVEEAARGIDYARERGAAVYLAVNVYPRPASWTTATDTVDAAARLGVDALILADLGLLEYAATRHPQLRLHLSVQGSVTTWAALAFYQQRFGIRRAVLPRVLSLAQVRRVAARAPVEIEVFGFGSLCVMAEGRCALSSYVTGESPNMQGICSPAHAVSWEETADGQRQWRLNGVLVDRYGENEAAGYPTLCKGRFRVGETIFHAIEEPTSLNVLPMLAEIAASGVRALKVEGRQRSPAYVARVTRTLRAAIDACAAEGADFLPRAEWIEELDALSEGRCNTLGAYHRPWQ